MTCILLVAFGAIFLYKSYALYEEKKILMLSMAK